MILAIESATPRGSVALVAGGAVIREIGLPDGLQPSATYLAAVDRLLSDGGSGPERIRRVAVSAGPGSFTGLRVGMAAAKGFCFGWGVPIVPVPTLHALATRFPRKEATVCPVLDARKREVYAGFYRWEGDRCVPAAPDAAIPPGRLPEFLPEGEVLFCGDGIHPYRSLIRERFGSRALFPPPGEEYPRAGAVGILAGRMLAGGKEEDPRSIVPAYLRPSEAEVRRRGGSPRASPRSTRNR
ncbi:MAG: tRNA (adenosine(37)-N6)-threonylcarbamoyltransferase complex dimerization subunit type 1 TsaB [Deltaproteobacteria bacterium]